jgi:hypothetical protein
MCAECCVKADGGNYAHRDSQGGVSREDKKNLARGKVAGYNRFLWWQRVQKFGRVRSGRIGIGLAWRSMFGFAGMGFWS